MRGSTSYAFDQYFEALSSLGTIMMNWEGGSYHASATMVPMTTRTMVGGRGCNAER